MRAWMMTAAVLVLGIGIAAPAAPAATSDATARAAAGWVARDLQHTAAPTSAAAAGLTIDSILLLAVTGTSRDVADAAMDRVQAHADAYVTSLVGGTDNPGGYGKLAFALQVMGRDASPQLATLRTMIQPSGRVGTAGNDFDQAWAVLALARSVEGVPAQTVAYLETMPVFHKADSYGMRIIALLAAGRAPSDPSVTAAIDWLAAQQQLDGSFHGNANSTGLAAHAARRVATPTATGIANAATAFIRELQVTCASPLIPGDDPSVGGGFPVSWIGAIAYSADGQDQAISDGIRPAHVITWRYTTLQAPLALPGLASLANASITGADASTDITPRCSSGSGSGSTPKPNTPAPTGGTSSPRRLTVRASSRPVAVGSRVRVRVSKLAARERYVVTLSGRVVARGRATSKGSVSTRIRIPRTLATHPRRVLRVRGTKSARTGSTRIATAARRTLRISAPRSGKRNARARISITGLLPGEAYRVQLHGRTIARGYARRTRVTKVTVRLRTSAGTRRIRVCGVTCTRRGTTTLTVRR